MTTSYEQQEIKKSLYGRNPKRPATDSEIDYVLTLDTLAEEIFSDGLSLYWSNPGDPAEFSTQRPCLQDD